MATDFTAGRPVLLTTPDATGLAMTDDLAETEWLIADWTAAELTAAAPGEFTGADEMLALAGFPFAGGMELVPLAGRTGRVSLSRLWSRGGGGGSLPLT